MRGQLALRWVYGVTLKFGCKWLDLVSDFVFCQGRLSGLRGRRARLLGLFRTKMLGLGFIGRVAFILPLVHGLVSDVV